MEYESNNDNSNLTKSIKDGDNNKSVEKLDTTYWQFKGTISYDKFNANIVKIGSTVTGEGKRENWPFSNLTGQWISDDLVEMEWTEQYFNYKIKGSIKEGIFSGTYLNKHLKTNNPGFASFKFYLTQINS